MYRSILRYEGDLTELKKELAVFRARIAAKKIHKFGIYDLRIIEEMERNNGGR